MKCRSKEFAKKKKHIKEREEVPAGRQTKRHAKRRYSLRSHFPPSGRLSLFAGAASQAPQPSLYGEQGFFFLLEKSPASPSHADKT